MKKASSNGSDYRSLAAKYGFTLTEARIILFLAFSFLCGLGYSVWFADASIPHRKFDYTQQDSIFYSLYNAEDVENPEDNDLSEMNPVAKTEYKSKSKTIPLENSINMNKAGLDELIRLPGIGEKTAQNIIDYRNKNSNFKSIDDILNVKGIGTAKLNKIRKYIYIE